MSRQGWTRPIVFFSRKCDAALRVIEKAGHDRDFSIATDFLQWLKKRDPWDWGVTVTNTYVFCKNCKYYFC